MDQFPGIGRAWTDAVGHMGADYAGFADRENRVPVDGGTVFPACSISKFVTALCVMRLCDQGALDLDAPANRSLRQWKVRAADGRESGATVRSFLCHTAGCADDGAGFRGLRQGDPAVSLMDILEGRTAYNSRPVRIEKPEGTEFEYSDAGYCVLQLLVQEKTGKAFEDAARELLFDPLRLDGVFFASPGNMARFESRMATGYDENGLPLPGRFPPVPDLAASGLWSTPKALLAVAMEFLAAYRGESAILSEKATREMAKPNGRFPWAGLGVFLRGQDILVSQGWGENGQCMLKMDCRTGAASVDMTNRDPGVDQAASGVEQLTDSVFASGSVEA